MKILVTGAAGFIGSHLAERLAGKGHIVCGIDCFSNYYSTGLKEINALDIQNSGVELLRLDLAQDELDAVLDGVEIIYHLAAQPGNSAQTSFDCYIRNNLYATRNLLDAAKKLSTLKCLINVSTSSVYGSHATDNENQPPKPISYYGVTKLAAEQLALSHQREGLLPACSLRLFSVYGERERPDKLYHKLINCILNEEEFPLYEGALQHTRSFTYVSDVIDGFESVLNHLDRCQGEIFNIGSDIEITTGEGIELVQNILGRKANFKMLPRRPGDQLKTCANIDKARQVLNYNPKVEPAEGLKAQVKWHQERLSGKIAH